MTRVFNFSAGPGTLPEEVLLRAADEMLDWHGSGQSVMEMSHRGKDYRLDRGGGRGRSAYAARGAGRLPRALPAGRGVAAVRDDPDEPHSGPGRR